MVPAGVAVAGQDDAERQLDRRFSRHWRSDRVDFAIRFGSVDRVDDLEARPVEQRFQRCGNRVPVIGHAEHEPAWTRRKGREARACSRQAGEPGAGGVEAALGDVLRREVHDDQRIIARRHAEHDGIAAGGRKREVHEFEPEDEQVVGADHAERRVRHRRLAHDRRTRRCPASWPVTAEPMITHAVSHRPSSSTVLVKGKCREGMVGVDYPPPHS
jgi:hypothetical protein